MYAIVETFHTALSRQSTVPLGSADRADVMLRDRNASPGQVVHILLSCPVIPVSDTPTQCISLSMKIGQD